MGLELRTTLTSQVKWCMIQHHRHDPPPPPPPFFVSRLKGVPFSSPLTPESSQKMNPRNGPQLDLKLNLSPPRMIGNHVVESPSRSSSTSVSPTSPQSSCVSSEPNQPDYYSIRQSTSPEATSMVLVGCPRCLMYVMLAEDDPRCPKCKSTVLLDVIHDSCTRKSIKKKS